MTLENLKKEVKREFDKKFVGITKGTKRVWWVDEPDRVLYFILDYIDKANQIVLPEEKQCLDCGKNGCVSCSYSTGYSQCLEDIKKLNNL